MHRTNSPAVSFVIPAYNASDSIGATLRSLIAQTYGVWEALIIDDGSVDATLEIAQGFASRDSRIRAESRPHGGTSAARNAGVALATYDWLVFLDADDWIDPRYLEIMTRELAIAPDLDAIHCGWAMVASNGDHTMSQNGPSSRDLFEEFARSCAFVVHSCVVRKSVVQAAGGFDTSLGACEDWDLWQRIARTGASFGAVPGTLAFYRMRSHSLSYHAEQMGTDGLRVLDRGHGVDSRVRHPLPKHRDGISQRELPSRRLYWLAWVAGLVLGESKDARALLTAVEPEPDSSLDPTIVAQCIFEAAVRSEASNPLAWSKLWPIAEQKIADFLLALEETSGTQGLARGTATVLERSIARQLTGNESHTIGSTYYIPVEVFAPIQDILAPPPVSRLFVVVKATGHAMGTLELPIIAGMVPAQVLTDAIAAEFGWAILGSTFVHTVYRSLLDVSEDQPLPMRRESLDMRDVSVLDGETIHAQYGWVIFLQELWGLPDWPVERFYDPTFQRAEAEHLQATDPRIEVEVSGVIPDVTYTGDEIMVVVLVGGTPVGIVNVPTDNSVVPAQAIQVAITLACGLELCVASVREGLVGKALDTTVSLRSLLASRSVSHDVTEFTAARVSTIANPTSNGLKADLGIGRRRPYVFGTSASRRAVLPEEAVEEVMEAAIANGEPLVDGPLPSRSAHHVVYRPEVIPKAFSYVRHNPQGSIKVREPESHRNRAKQHFDSPFMAQPDPWKYSSPYEQVKYEHTLSLLPQRRIRNALELACAEGQFTAQLAPRVTRLLATDVSATAVDRATARCIDHKNVRFQTLDLVDETLPGRFDLIVCSEVLYYLENLEVLEHVAGKIEAALEPGGYFLTAHAHLLVDEPEKPGFDWDASFGAKVICEVFDALPTLSLAQELRTPLYRIALFRRSPRLQFPLGRKSPRRQELKEQPTALPEHVAQRVRWNGGHVLPTPALQATVTERLPILMYHRVAPTGAEMTARYRVTPAAFEEQLHYLHAAGFYSVSLDNWRMARETKEPLPGKAILLTFDDGYLDFFLHAWPLLQRYGFSATVFLVADHVGGTAIWDKAYGEEVPLLGWSEIKELQTKGITFGSHTATHPHLPALGWDEVVRECARSRTILAKRLGMSIDTIAYPYGDQDKSIQHVAGACGYEFGLTTTPARCRPQDSLLALPRLEVLGDSDLAAFAVRLQH